MEPTTFNKNNGRVITGIFLVAAGFLLFAYKMGAPLPQWLFTWPVILIAVGLFLGFRHNFKNNIWIILVAVGGINLVNELRPDLNFGNYVAPVVIILIGLIFILRPSRRWNRQHNKLTENAQQNWKEHAEAGDAEFTEADYVDSVSVFGGVKKNILSKQFRGGDITCFMGGAEINLLQADLQKPAILEVTQVFGGTKLIVPANWNIKSEVVAVFGGIDDKRPVTAGNTNREKILILRGTTVFGGIDIRSY